MVNALVDYVTPPTIVPLQRVWDNFDGDTLDERWTLEDIAGTGSVAILDETDGGVRLTPGTNDNDSSELNFNDIRHYSETASQMIIVARKGGSVSGRLRFGLSLDNWTAGTSKVLMGLDNTAFTTLRNIATAVNTSQTDDTNWHKYLIEIKSTVTTAAIDGTLEAINTSSLPTVPLQPIFMRRKTGTGTHADLRFMEAYNR